MTFQRTAVAIALGLASVGACAGAAPAAGPPQGRGWTPELPASPPPHADSLARHDEDKSAPADAGADTKPRCPYGALEDPHRGFVRCLLPDERDAGWLPPPPQGEPPPPPPPEAARDAGAAPGALPVVEIAPPKFENGEVTRVEKSLGKASERLARCVADHGGLSGDVASVKVTFLVRSRGRAEGVEVAAAKGIGAEAAQCVRQTLRNRAIGAPTADPVGVTVVISFRPSR